LFLDEPTASMDPISRKQISNSIYNFKLSKNKTIVYCTHLLEEIEGLADKIAFLEKGKIKKVGKPRNQEIARAKMVVNV